VGKRLKALDRSSKYLDLLINIFVVILLVSNLVAQKLTEFGPFKVSAALLLFPITYIFGDIFTEVYGYAASRRAIWLGFLGSAVMTGMCLFAVWLPPAGGFKNQAAFEAVLGVVPRALTGSLIAFWAGEFANSLTVAKMKLWTNGRFLWTRTVGSTVVGQAVDTTVVVGIIFWGQPASVLWQLIYSGYLFKVVYEVVATPLTYIIVNWLKRAEGVDFFDRSTNFNPFRLRS
jgi:uncharacterized integral membrane protein (TIGR00697 family)